MEKSVTLGEWGLGLECQWKEHENGRKGIGR